MRVDGKSYKSLNFTLLKDKLLSGEKDQTFRTGFIPTYEEGEIIAISFKDKTVEYPIIEFLFLAKVLTIIPKQIKDLNEYEAKRDGFNSVSEFQKGIMELNNIKSVKHWGFITRFQKIPTVWDYLK